MKSVSLEKVKWSLPVKVVVRSEISPRTVPLPTVPNFLNETTFPLGRYDKVFMCKSIKPTQREFQLLSILFSVIANKILQYYPKDVIIFT